MHFAPPNFKTWLVRAWHCPFQRLCLVVKSRRKLARNAICPLCNASCRLGCWLRVT